MNQISYHQSPLDYLISSTVNYTLNISDFKFYNNHLLEYLIFYFFRLIF